MLDHALDAIVDHNRPAAAMWNAGGAAYNEVSFAISDALMHAAQRLAPRPGDAVLDVATGTGWTARNAAMMGAEVTAVDIAADLLAAARDLSASASPPIRYRLADAEALPFADGHFDKVISTFGVMFAADHRHAAAELARVCRSGGRLCLATWTPASSVARFFALIGAYTGAPAPDPSPLQWGDPAYLERLLGDHFTLRFEPGVATARHESLEDIWAWYARGFGPLRVLLDSLDDDRRAALKRDIDDYHRPYLTDTGLTIGRDYLVTIGTRR